MASDSTTPRLPTTVVVRTVQASRGPRMGRQRAAVERARQRVGYDVLLPHAAAHACQGCDRPLLSRVPVHLIRSWGGPSCPRCPVSGAILAPAAEYAIPGFRHAEIAEDVLSGTSAKTASVSPRNVSRIQGGFRPRGGRPAVGRAETLRRKREWARARRRDPSSAA